VQDSTQTDATQADKDFASELIASGVTTQPAETVIAVLEAHRNGASINAAARHLGSTTGRHSGSWRLPPNTASGSSWWSADGSPPPRASTTRIAANAGTHGLSRIVNPWA
jgi:hypothetical protein